MFTLKISVTLLLAVACVAANITDSDRLKYDHEAVEKSAVVASTTLATPEPKPNTTTVEPTTSTSAKPPKTTTLSPNTTTTTSPSPAPNTTTTTTITPSPAPNSTTVAPTTTPAPNTTTIAPNVTTTVAPSPAPTPGRSWDGPSFFGGMVLAFGIVGIGYVGYRFFYLGRGGAYHTL